MLTNPLSSNNTFIHSSTLKSSRKGRVKFSLMTKSLISFILPIVNLPIKLLLFSSYTEIDPLLSKI